MTVTQLLMFAPMIALLVWAAVVDLRFRRIPNWLTFSLALAGLAQSFTPVHTVSPGPAALGLLTGFGVTFLLFAIGALGGGDVKLLAAIGALIGPMPALVVFAISAVIGMVIVLAQAAAQGRLTRLFRNSAVIAAALVHADGASLEQIGETGKACSGGGPGATGKPLPYAVPLLLATLLTLAVAASR
jgi:prepilin peptidase CpaA